MRDFSGVFTGNVPFGGINAVETVLGSRGFREHNGRPEGPAAPVQPAAELAPPQKHPDSSQQAC